MDQWTNGSTDQCTKGPVDQWTNGLMGQWTSGSIVHFHCIFPSFLDLLKLWNSAGGGTSTNEDLQKSGLFQLLNRASWYPLLLTVSLSPLLMENLTYSGWFGWVLIAWPIFQSAAVFTVDCQPQYQWWSWSWSFLAARASRSSVNPSHILRLSGATLAWVSLAL